MAEIIQDGEYSEVKENFTFTYQPDSGKNRGNIVLVIRQSEYSIKKEAKNLGLTVCNIMRDRGFWTVCRGLTQTYIYSPVY